MTRRNMDELLEDFEWLTSQGITNWAALAERFGYKDGRSLQDAVTRAEKIRAEHEGD